MTTMDMAKITFNLVVIYVIGGLIMAAVYAITSPIMFIKAKEEKWAWPFNFIGGQWILRVFQAKDACESFAWISYALLCIVVQ